MARKKRKLLQLQDKKLQKKYKLYYKPGETVRINVEGSKYHGMMGTVMKRGHGTQFGVMIEDKLIYFRATQLEEVSENE